MDEWDFYNGKDQKQIFDYYWCGVGLIIAALLWLASGLELALVFISIFAVIKTGLYFYRERVYRAPINLEGCDEIGQSDWVDYLKVFGY